MKLAAHGLSVRLKNRPVLSGVHFCADPGELTAVIGPNGAGKSTLLRALAGLIPISQGQVTVGARPLAEWPPGELARVLAYLPQERTVHWALSARNVVALGRLPFQPLGARETPADGAAIEAAIATMNITALMDRPASEMSGGELARVLLARALAQEPRSLLADEPAAGLDPAHQLGLFHHFASLAEKGRTVVVALHDLSLAARFCHNIVLLHAGRCVASGPPAQVLTAEHLAGIYGIRAHYRIVDGVPTVLPLDLLP